MTLLRLRACIHKNCMIELEDYEFNQIHEFTKFTFGMSAGYSLPRLQERHSISGIRT